MVGYQRFGDLCCLHLQGEVKQSEVKRTWMQEGLPKH